MSIEVRGLQGWEPLERTPRVSERGLLTMRGLEPGRLVEIGDVLLTSDADGRVALRSFQSTSLQHFVGLVDVHVDRRFAGTLEVVPEKLSFEAYRTLLTDLQSVWAGLVIGNHPFLSIGVAASTAAVFWERVAHPIDHALRAPREFVDVELAQRRYETLRRPRELTRSVAFKGALGLPGWGRRLVRRVSEPEIDLLVSTLRRLSHLAEVEGDAPTLAAIRRRLAHPLLAGRPVKPVRLTWGMRSDDRYRGVLAVHEELAHPERHAVVGPAEVRDGARALPRLYEYWVFLQALRLAEATYGPPAQGYEHLARPMSDGRRLLEIFPGTSVEFPGEVTVVFEPIITAQHGWGGLTLNPHPDPLRPRRHAAQPDVVILKRGDNPSATVLDAKYVQPQLVDRASAEIHEKYARIMWAGRPVVDQVLAVHPHDRRPTRWAGYGSVPWRPGHPCAAVPLLEPPVVATVATLSSTEPEAASFEFTRVRLLLDQFSTHDVARHERKDIRPLLDRARAGLKVEQAIAVMPDIPELHTFANVLAQHGWAVTWCQDVARRSSLDALIDLAASAPSDTKVVIVSNDPQLRASVHQIDRHIDFFAGFSDLPDYEPGIRGWVSDTTTALDAEGGRYLADLVPRLRRQVPLSWDIALGVILDDLALGRAYRAQLDTASLELSFIGQLAHALALEIEGLPVRPKGLAVGVRSLIARGGPRSQLQLVEGQHAPFVRRRTAR